MTCDPKWTGLEEVLFDVLFFFPPLSLVEVFVPFFFSVTLVIFVVMLTIHAA